MAYLTHSKKKCSKNVFYWNTTNKYIDRQALKGTKHIIHLSGLSIDSVWTKKNKTIMYQSRIDTSELLYQECISNNIQIKTFISASAMGYYGFNQNGLKKEQDKAGESWMSELCVKWEEKADNFKLIGARVIKLRLSLLIDKNSGILHKTCLSFLFGIGINLGHGKQQLPWIHIKDAAKFITYAIQQKSIHGVFNLASPQQISYYQFIKTIQKIKYQNSLLITIPEILLNFIFPQKKVLLMNNISLSIKKLKHTEFEWDFPTIKKAIEHELL